MLDVGCGSGQNLARLVRYGSLPLGIDPARDRLHAARAAAPVAAARSEALPLPDASTDLVYVSHALHHAADLERTLREIRRVLRPGGLLFLIETVDDSPLMRLARRINPSWEGDPVLQRFRSADLRAALARHELEVRAGTPFNWMYFAWELFPILWRPFELLTPLFVLLESALARPLRRFGGHCWFVAKKPGPELFPPAAYETQSRGRWYQLTGSRSR